MEPSKRLSPATDQDEGMSPEAAAMRTQQHPGHAFLGQPASGRPQPRPAKRPKIGEPGGHPMTPLAPLSMPRHSPPTTAAKDHGGKQKEKSSHHHHQQHRLPSHMEHLEERHHYVSTCTAPILQSKFMSSYPSTSTIGSATVSPKLFLDLSDFSIESLRGSSAKGKEVKLAQVLSDERAQELIDQALESGSLKQRNIVAVITGITGSGKTWLLNRLFYRPPPDLYSSTGITEQSFRGLLHHIGNLASWKLLSDDNILNILASRFCMGMASPSRLSNPHSLLWKSPTSQAMVRLVKAAKGSENPLLLELVHMIDTGGQPEFMEVLPCLVHHSDLTVLVMNLAFGLDEYPKIAFHEKGTAFKRGVRSQCTNRQTIRQLACTMQAKRPSHKRGQRSRIIAVGTHRDCVQGDLAARLEALDQELRKILLPVCGDELILYCSSGKITFAVNLLKPDDDDERMLELIREKISESGVGEISEVPGSYFIFEQDLLKYAEQVGRDILSLEECQQVGESLKMTGEAVVAALIYFHRQNTFIYFQHVLPNVTFVKPQVPLDFINAVVSFSYKVRAGEFQGFPAKYATLLKDSIITEEMLCHKSLSDCFIYGLYEPRHALQLSCHTYTIAPLSNEQQSNVKTKQPASPEPVKQREYLMMCLLASVPEKSLPQHLPPSSKVAPLVVRFSEDCVPLSCFGSTISCLLSTYNWRVSRNEDGSPECLAHNIVSLYDPDLPVKIVLVDSTYHLEIHVEPEEEIDGDLYSDICSQVRETVFGAIDKVFDIMQLTDIEVSPAFLCPCRKVSEAHSASVYRVKARQFLRCSRTEASAGAAQWRHTVWLESDQTPNSAAVTSAAATAAAPQGRPTPPDREPSLPELLRLELPQRVGNNYTNFGIFLLEDRTGSRVDAIEDECCGKPYRITRKILQEWVEGRGAARTWDALVKTLRDCDLNTLADHIQASKLPHAP